MIIGNRNSDKPKQQSPFAEAHFILLMLQSKDHQINAPKNAFCSFGFRRLHASPSRGQPLSDTGNRSSARPSRRKALKDVCQERAVLTDKLSILSSGIFFGPIPAAAPSKTNTGRRVFDPGGPLFLNQLVEHLNAEIGRVPVVSAAFLLPGNPGHGR